MKRLTLLAVSVLLLAGCQSDITGPEPENETLMGSGGQLEPNAPQPSYNETLMGSGG